MQKPKIRIVLSLWLLACLLPGCGQEQKAPPAPTPVSVRVVEPYSGGGEVRYSANIQPYAQVDLAFKSGGYLVGIHQVRGVDGRKRNVQEGDFVARGARLAQVRPSDYEARLGVAAGQLGTAQAALKHADLDLERARKLYATNSLTKSDYDKAMARYEEARSSVAGASSQVREAKIHLEDASLKAPVAGLMLQRKVEVGDLVQPGAVGFTLANTGEVKVVFGISDLMLKHIRLGEALEVTTEALRARVFRGLVTSLSPSADPKSRVFDVQITIPNPKQELKVGMIASVLVPTGRAPAALPAVPLTAVVRSPTNPQGYALYVVEEKDGKEMARLRDNVQLGEVYGNLIVVTKGVQLGERVIVTGATLVREGQAVRVIPPAE